MMKRLILAVLVAALLLSVVTVAMAQRTSGRTAAAAVVAARKPKPKVPSKKAPIARGKQVVAANHCARCHTINGKGGKVGPNLNRVAPTLTTKQIETQVHKGGGGMPPFPKVPKADLDAVAAYLKSLK